MKYALLIYDEEQWSKTMTESERQKVLTDYYAFTKEVTEAGILVAAEPLEPVATATTIRKRNNQVLKTDGPFAETKEQLAGFYLLECSNLDEAIEYAAKIPSAKFGTIEVRPAIDLGMN